MEEQYSSLVSQSNDYQLLYETNLKLGNLLDLIDLLLQSISKNEFAGMLGAIQLNIASILDPIQKQVYK